MGKKSKKHDKYDQDCFEGNNEKPSLKLVLKVGGVPLSLDAGNDSWDDGAERRAKKKRKHQEKSDSEDESEVSQRWNQQNYDDNDDDDDYGKSRIQREKKALNEEKTALQCCLEHMQKVLQRKDVNGFFAFPVTDSIAPGYSNIIPKAMDFSTMRKKIEKGLYKSVAEYKSDFQLMMNNCMAYNHPDTIYHKEAKRLLAVGNKHINKERINQMRRNFSFMANVSKDEVGLLDDDQENVENSLPAEAINHKSSAERKLTSVGRFEAIPDDMSPEEILRQNRSAAAAASERLQASAPNSKIGYLKKKPDGTTTLSILNPDNSGIISPKERVVDLGGLIGRLSSGSDSVAVPREDKRNRVTPVTYLNYGAFTSFAPVYDSASANLDKEQSDLLLSTYGDETGIQYAKSLQHFVANCGEYATSMVDDLLDVLTNGMHSKTSEHLSQSTGTTTNNNSRPDQRQTDVDSSSTAKADDVTTATDEKLTKASNLILSLHETQHNRLNQEHATRVDNCKPSLEEINLANQVTDELTQLIKNVAPGDVVEVKELRKAMGVSLDLFDADGNIEDLLQQNTNGNLSSVSASTVENPAIFETVSLDQGLVQANARLQQVHGRLQVCEMSQQPLVLQANGNNSFHMVQADNNSSTTTFQVVQATNNNGGGGNNFQLVNANIHDGTIMLGGGGQVILAGGHQFNPGAQLIVGGNFQQNPAPYAVINAGGAGALQILQAGGNQAAGGQVVGPVVQGGSIFLQGDGSRQQIITAGPADVGKLQPGSIVIQQPVYNTNISIGQQPSRQDQQQQQFFIQ